MVETKKQVTKNTVINKEKATQLLLTFLFSILPFDKKQENIWWDFANESPFSSLVITLRLMLLARN